MCNKKKPNKKTKSYFFIKELLFCNFFEDLENSKTIKIEKNITNFKKIFFLIRFFNFFHQQILFLGSPLLLNLFFKSFSIKSKHLFFLNEDWLLGFLTNKKIFPQLIICFKINSFFFSKESFKKQLPLICFLDAKDKSFQIVDFIVFLNLKSHISIIFLCFFLKELLSKKNGKR